MSKRKATQVTQFYLLQLIDGEVPISWLIPESDVSKEEDRMLRNCAGHTIHDNDDHVLSILWRTNSPGFWIAEEHFDGGDPRFDASAEGKWQKYKVNGATVFGFRKPIKGVYQCFAN